MRLCCRCSLEKRVEHGVRLVRVQLADEEQVDSNREEREQEHLGCLEQLQAGTAHGGGSSPEVISSTAGTGCKQAARW